MATLNERDLAILRHVHLHRVSSRELLQQQFFPSASRNAVGKVIARLAQHDWLREHRFAAGFHYCTLGRRGVRELDASPTAVRPFTEQSLPAAYALSALCVTNNFTLLAPPQFQQQYPQLSSAGTASIRYFIYPTVDGNCLATALLDRANSRRHLLRKLDRIILQRYRIPAFFTLIQQGRFCITILTGWPAKRDYLAATLGRQLRGPTRVVIHVVPQLQKFYLRT